MNFMPSGNMNAADDQSFSKRLTGIALHWRQRYARHGFFRAAFYCAVKGMPQSLNSRHHSVAGAVFPKSFPLKQATHEENAMHTNFVRQQLQGPGKAVSMFAVFLVGAVVLPPAIAQSFPSKPVTIISSSASGDFDTTLRLAAQTISERTGKTFIVQPAPGGLGILAPLAMLRAEPDGHTIGSIFSSNITVAPLTMKDRPFNTLNDFAAITMVLKNGVALMAQSSLPANNVAELIKLAKSKPGQMRVGYAGIGSKLMMLQFEKMTGTQFLQVPYKSGAEMMASLLNSDLDLHLDLAPSALPMIRAGRAKALSIGTLTRTPLLPNVPSVSETLPGLEMQSWLGLIASAKVPQDRVEWLNREFVAALKTPALKDKIVTSGYEFVANSTQQFTQALRTEVLENEKLVKEFNLTLN